jgi:copper chaperone CopZ
MRRRIISVFAMLIIGLSASPFPAYADRISIAVKGMVCSFCAQGIKKTFGRKDAVEDVAVDLEKKIVTITTREGESLSDSEIRESIVDSGYEVLTIERATHD